ncbi:hypothetical protein CHS0354_002978 [Potamilus streckersoni]|uniref:Sushi domain-containing protein n=1 Tax=Potamilus streckersoni TaxID=2493646 RepID=A0AAE0RS95_9BIVA|nr:hypothetical protein CHS0354_002978 [Potamilus streckersoni]
MEKNGLTYFLLLLIVSICSAASSCDMQIPNGDVIWCGTDGEPCVYSCHKGYKRHDIVSWLKCSTSGEWVSLFSHWLESTNDFCTPMPCPTVISKGAFSAACKAVVGSTCSFSCEAGYMRNTSVSEVTCQTSTEWSADLTSLCLRPDGQQCPYYIPRGDLNLTCIREPGQTCNFTCDEGYQPSISPPTIACGSNSEWNHNPESLCQEIICPKFFEGGYIAETCSRKYKDMCSEYQCNPGYVKLARARYIQCDESGKWIDYNENSSACVREDQLCPDKFPGGYFIWHCNRIQKERCSYFCYSGYLHNPSITWLTCQENRLWNVDANLLCIQSDMSNTSSSTTFRTTSPAATTRQTSVFPKLLCNMKIPHGEIAWWCASKSPPCPYSCHEGYKKHETVSWLNCSTSGQWVPQYQYQFDGVRFSVEDLCTYISKSERAYWIPSESTD